MFKHPKVPGLYTWRLNVLKFQDGRTSKHPGIPGRTQYLYFLGHLDVPKDMVVDMVDIMVADMEVNMVANMVADLVADM